MHHCAKRLRTAALILVPALLMGTVSGLAQSKPPAAPAEWPTPQLDQLPAGKWGELVRYGHELVSNTSAHIGPQAKDPAMRFAGNNFACQTCHLEGGTKKFGLPLVGVFADFPQYRPRENVIGTIEERVNGCMERSMNGRTLPLDSREMKAFVAYMKFLSEGVPVGAQVVGRGTPTFKLPNRAADPKRGAAVYAEQCAACHGEHGQGTRADAGSGKVYEYPPVWGADSYNTGAGMYRLIVAARFIRSNMPFGTSFDAPAVSDDDAYDVAAFINSQPRPEKANLDRDFPDRGRKPVDAPFPPWDDSFSATQHKYGPFQPIIEHRRAKAAPK